MSLKYIQNQEPSILELIIVEPGTMTDGKCLLLSNQEKLDFPVMYAICMLMPNPTSNFSGDVNVTLPFVPIKTLIVLPPNDMIG